MQNAMWSSLNWDQSFGSFQKVGLAMSGKAIQHWINELKLKPTRVLLSEKCWVQLVRVFHTASYHELLNNSGFSQGVLHVKVYLVMKEIKPVSVCIWGVTEVVLCVCICMERRRFSFTRQLQTDSEGIFLHSANKGMQHYLCWYKQ